MLIKIGQSTDIHELVKGRSLILGGVKIEHEKGCLAHSDGDVLVHAIAESIIGALGLGDLGTHFSDTDIKNKGRSSLEILKEVNGKLVENNYRICNIDSIIIIEKPKLAGYIEIMKKNIALVLGLDYNLVNIKATRGERLGYIGREEGVMAQAVTLLIKDEH